MKVSTNKGLTDLADLVVNDVVTYEQNARVNTDPRGFRGLKKSTCDVYRVYHDYSSETGEVTTQYYPISKEYGFRCYGRLCLFEI